MVDPTSLLIPIASFLKQGEALTENKQTTPRGVNFTALDEYSNIGQTVNAFEVGRVSWLSIPGRP